MKKTSLIFLCAISLVACQATEHNRGNILEPDSLAQITAGTSTREDVATKLGTPTQISTFDEKIWYYIGRQTEQYSFFAPEVVKQQAVEVDFDDKGVVQQVKNLDLAQAGDIDPVDRVTPSYGRSDTFMKELLGDISHPVPDLSNQTKDH